MKAKRFRLVATATTLTRVRHHIEPEQLYAYAAGSLTPNEVKRIRRHLEGCLGCSLNLGRAEKNWELTRQERDAKI